ncbi:LytR C-terminal domain-containing protein [Egicoccus sp. AB-alg2]|uniref:LytR C-terminal domain-containing protein n=1 Tax=Egicoccus sp. AB-alg2 TaxID=3242693 RepID=UPI00359EF717
MRAGLVGLTVLVAAAVAVGALTGALSLRRPSSPATSKTAGTLSAAATDAAPVVRVVDGSGRPHLARDVADLARPAGFVVAVVDEPADQHHERTRILVHLDDPASLAVAADLRDLLGVGVIEKATAGAPDGLDISVVVGADLSED